MYPEVISYNFGGSNSQLYIVFSSSQLYVTSYGQLDVVSIVHHLRQWLVGYIDVLSEDTLSGVNVCGQ